MFRRDLLAIVRPHPSDTGGLVYAEGTEEYGLILAGRARSPVSGETYEIKNGYLDLLGPRIGADNVANLTNFLPGAGPLYEPLWRTRSLTLLTGENFPNEREVEIISELMRLDRDGLYLDLGCSAGLYTRGLAASLGGRGDVVGIDISPSMLKEAARRARRSGIAPSFARGDAKNLPFADASFTGDRLWRLVERVRQPGARLARDETRFRARWAGGDHGHPEGENVPRPVPSAIPLGGWHTLLRARGGTKPTRPRRTRSRSVTNTQRRLLRRGHPPLDGLLRFKTFKCCYTASS